MGVNPNQGSDANQGNPYRGGYSGYPSTPSTPKDDPYGAFSGQGAGSQTGGGYQQGSYGQQQSYSQQQQYYQPPRSASARSTGSPGSEEPTSTGLNARSEAVLSYLFWWLSGLVFFVIERKNRFVRFHAAQSFLFLGSVFVLYVFLRFLSIVPFIGFLLSPVISCALFVLLVPAGLIWLFLMIQAYRGVTVRLPIVAEYAEGLVTRFSRKARV